MGQRFNEKHNNSLFTLFQQIQPEANNGYVINVYQHPMTLVSAIIVIIIRRVVTITHRNNAKRILIDKLSYEL